MRRQGGVLAFLAALGTFTYVSHPGRQTDSERQTPTAISEPVPQSETELAGTFSKFDKNRTFKIFSRADPQKRYLPEFSPAASFDWAIATVPDPERSLLSLDFDREIEAIQLAATDAGYRFERYWFPWRAETGTSAATQKDASFITTEESRIVVTRGTADEKRKDLPGVLLFRSAQATGKPLAVFLVGETPTGGIAVRQFGAALSLGSSLGNSGNGRLPIIGPYFSGSLDSLAKLIFSNRLHPDINTWTTSSAAQQGFITTMREFELGFRKFEIDDTTAINLFVDYVRHTWHDHEPVVILTEEQTAFGAGVGSTKDPNDTAGRITDKNVFKVPFPRNLARLRNASESQAHIAGFAGSRTTEIPHTGLLLSLKEEEGGEEIPTYSRQQTPVSQESVLFALGGLLRTDMVHYVGIFATDPLDTLFLARYLRSACPNLRLFVPSPDLLFEHGSDSFDYSGILSVSRYPLLPFSQLWSPGHKGMRVFPSARSEEIYNATLATLGREADERDQSDPFRLRTNPVWLTVAGRGGFEPIAVLDSPESHPDIPPSPDAPKASFVFEYWPMWGYLFIGILLGCIGYCVAVLFAKPFGRRMFAMFSTEPDQFKNSPHPAAHVFLLSGIGLCLATIAAVWLSAPGIILQQNLAAHNPHATIVYGLILLFAGAASVACIRTVRQRSWSGARSSLRRAAGLPVAAAGGVLLLVISMPIRPSFAYYHGRSLHRLWVIYWIASAIIGATIACSVLPRLGLQKHYRKYAAAEFVSFAVAIAAAFFVFFGIARDSTVDFLAAYRSLDLTNGVSPLIPISLLLVILGVTALFNLRRMAYFEDRRPEIPVMRRDEFCSNLSAVKNKINHRISTFRPPLACLLVALPFGLCLTLAWFESAQTLEKPLVDRFILILVFACGIFISLAWIRLLAIWFAFREFLQQIERHPIRQVMNRLPKGYMWSPVWQGGGQKRTHVLLARSVECLEALLANDGTPARLKTDVGKQLESLQPLIKALLASSATGKRFNPDKFREIERSLRQIAYWFVQYLRGEKWALGHCELVSETAAYERPESLDAPGEVLSICGEFVAFRFLAYINFVLWHVDNLVTYLSAAFLLLVIALNSYAFRSRTVFDWGLVILFVVLTAGVVFVLSQTARDALLSRITNTTEGKLDLNFLSHLISYGALPVLVLLATHFPSVGQFFFSWVKPALEAIH